MYSSLMMLVAIIAPIPAIVKSMQEKTTPFRAVLQGLVTGAVAALIVMVIADLAGSNIFDDLMKQVDALAESFAKDPNMAAMLGEDMTEAQRLKMLNELYGQSIKLLPSVVFIMSAIAAYIEYIIISKIYKPGGLAAIPMTKMREFNLPRNIAMVWLGLYLLSLLVTATGIIENDIVFLNINSIFNFAFCIQGISLIFMLFYSKKLPQALAVVLIIAIGATNLGKTVLMIAGFTDIIFGVKYRMKRAA